MACRATWCSGLVLLLTMSLKCGMHRKQLQITPHITILRAQIEVLGKAKVLELNLAKLMREYHTLQGLQDNNGKPIFNHTSAVQEAFKRDMKLLLSDIIEDLSLNVCSVKELDALCNVFKVLRIGEQTIIMTRPFALSIPQ